MKRLFAAAACAACLGTTALANDGFGGLTATGLQFDKTDAVQMLTEDLYLSLDEIRVAYTFRNATSADVSGQVIFPLPPIVLPAIYESDFAIPREELDKTNLVDFKVTVDGKPVKVEVDRIAVLKQEHDGASDPGAVYRTPGEDVTAILGQYGIPLSLNWEKLVDVLGRLPQAAKDDLKARGLADFYDGQAYPLWAIIERYHWPQTFAAGKDVKIAHSYRGAFPGGVFGWYEPIEPGDYQQELIDRYCIDKGTQSAIKKALKKDGQYWMGMAYYMDYVLTTANTWAGPIGDFKVTIDKGNAKNVISLCIDGIKKTGPTTFVSEKKNFTPDRELQILLVPDVSTLPQ